MDSPVRGAKQELQSGLSAPLCDDEFGKSVRHLHYARKAQVSRLDVVLFLFGLVLDVEVGEVMLHFCRELGLDRIVLG